MFRKTFVLGIFAKFGQLPVAEFGRNCQKHIYTPRLHTNLSLYPSLYDLPVKSPCPYKIMFRKTAVFFGNLVKFGKLRVVEHDRNRQNAHLHTNTFNLFRKTAVLGLFDHYPANFRWRLLLFETKSL